MYVNNQILIAKLKIEVDFWYCAVLDTFFCQILLSTSAVLEKEPQFHTKFLNKHKKCITTSHFNGIFWNH